MTVAVALIVKNEEQTLGRALDSIASHVDEIVVVDTGSSDATKEIARRFTDCIFDFPWRQDFSAARQFAFGLAETYYHKRDWRRVIHWSQLGRAMPQPETMHILNPMDQSFHWIIFYTNALFNTGETREALEWTRRALEIRPDDEWHRQNHLTLTGALEDDRKLVSLSQPVAATPFPQACELKTRNALRLRTLRRSTTQKAPRPANTSCSTIRGKKSPELHSSDSDN